MAGLLKAGAAYRKNGSARKYARRKLRRQGNDRGIGLKANGGVSAASVRERPKTEALARRRNVMKWRRPACIGRLLRRADGVAISMAVGRKY